MKLYDWIMVALAIGAGINWWLGKRSERIEAERQRARMNMLRGMP